MSVPRGDALNDLIDKDTFACKYSQFDDAVKIVVEVGKNSYMAKLDIKNVFRLCPVRKEHWWLLGFKWETNFYVHTCLPFGSQSSPKIFNDFAELLCWVFFHFRRYLM